MKITTGEASKPSGLIHQRGIAIQRRTNIYIKQGIRQTREVGGEFYNAVALSNISGWAFCPKSVMMAESIDFANESVLIQMLG